MSEYALHVRCSNAHKYTLEPVVNRGKDYIGYSSDRDFCIVCGEETDGGVPLKDYLYDKMKEQHDGELVERLKHGEVREGVQRSQHRSFLGCWACDAIDHFISSLDEEARSTNGD